MSERLSSEKGNYNPELTAQRLAECISKKNLTTQNGTPNASKIADATKLDRRTIGKILKADAGASYNRDTFEALATYFETPVGYLLGDHNFQTQSDLETYNRMQQRLSLENKQARENEDRKSLFAALGYIYKTNDARRKIGQKKYVLVPADNPEHMIPVSETEIKTIISYLKRQLKFSLFEISEVE